MSNEKNNPEMNQQKDSKRNPYLIKENTTEMTENTYDPGHTLKSSNQALDSQNNNVKNFMSSSISLDKENTEKYNDSLNKNEILKNKKDLNNSANASYENNLIDEEYTDSVEEPLYIMTLELERGKSEKLRIFPNSDPYTLAIDFCRANNLEEDAVKYLTSEIENLLNKNKFLTGDENNVNNENLDNTQEEFIENYNHEEENNGNMNYNYANHKNSSRYSYNSGKNYKYSNYDDVDYTDNYDDNNTGFPLYKTKYSNKNSKEIFYNNPEMINNEFEENITQNNNSHRKTVLSENIPYLVHEQITEVDEENNITIEKLKSSKTENDNSRSPIEKETEINEHIDQKYYPKNSHLINKVIKDEDYSENYLTSSGKSVTKEYGDNVNQLKIKKTENENISRSQENILEKDAINNISCRSNYNYFKNINNNEINCNGSIREKGRIMPNDVKYSDSQIYLRDNLTKDPTIFNENLNHKNELNLIEDDKVREPYLNQNEEKFFTFKQPDDSGKENKSHFNKNTNSNVESLTNSNKNFTFKDNILINNQDYSNEINLNYDYNQNMNSDLNKTIKKNKNESSNKNLGLLNQFNYSENATPLKINSNDTKIKDLNYTNTKSTEKLYFIADTPSPNGNIKQSNSKDKDKKSILNPPKYSENYNLNNINNNINIKIKDYDLDIREHAEKSSNLVKIKENVSDNEIKKKNPGGRTSQNSSSIIRPNSRSKYQPLVERVNNNQDNSSNSKILAYNIQNTVPNYGYMSYSNINNKILNYKENEENSGYPKNTKDAGKTNINLKDSRNKDSKSVPDNSRINSNKIMDHRNQRIKSNQGIKEDLKKEIDNVDSNNINNFINSIENEITSIKGTQSSNNDRYDKDNKDKSDLNNLNNLNNLIKVTYDKRNDESDIILNNNINTYNTQNNIQNTKSNISNINENQENNYNQRNNLNENQHDSTKNIVYRKAESDINYVKDQREIQNNKVHFSDNEYCDNKDIVNEKSNTRNVFNKEFYENQIPNTLSINYIDNNNKNPSERERSKSKKNNSAYNPTKLYTKDRIVSIKEHKCIHKKLNLKGLNIFDRLYKEAEIKRVLPKKVLKEEENEIYQRNNKIHDSADPNLNFGEILYAREKISKEEKEKKLMQIKYEQDINQMKNLTFTPEIHEYNNVACRYKYYQDNHYEYKRIKENKINQIKTNNKYREGINLNIDPNSDPIEEDKRGMTTKNPSRKLQLTEDQILSHFIRNEKKREKIIKEENSKYTFQPKIGNIYHFDQKFNERQMFYFEISEKNIKQLKEVYGNNSDLKTGQPYFKPNIVSKNQIPEAAYLNTSYENRDVFAKLYSQAIKQKHEKEISANKLFYDINYGNKPDINSETEIIYNKIKKEIFSKIFKILDYDYDEILTGNNIFFGLKKIDEEIKTILQPLAIQLREENETLIESEFIRAMEDLYELSSYNDKRVLIDFYKKIKHKSADKIVFERNNLYRNEKINEAEKYFDNHLNWRNIDCFDPNQSKNNDNKNKRKNNILNKETISKDSNNSFSFRPKINKKSEMLAKRHDEKVVKEINEINRINESNNIDSDKFFKNTISTINTSIYKLGGIKEFTFNNFKNKSIVNMNQKNDFNEYGFENNENYGNNYSSNYIHSNLLINKGDNQNGTLNNYHQ